MSEGVQTNVQLKITKEEAPFAPKEQLGDYEVRRWLWFEKSRATEAATKAIDRERGIIQWDVTVYYQHMLFYSVKKVPEGINWTLEFIKDGLDVDIGDILNRIVLEVNTVSRKERKDFLGQLSSGADIPGSISTGPAQPSKPSQSPET